MPYKAREALAKLQRAGFVISGANQGRTRSFGILMAARPMWPCTRETSPLALSALCLSKPAFLKKRSGGFDLQQATP